jgi:hypothetical protein
MERKPLDGRIRIEEWRYLQNVQQRKENMDVVELHVANIGRSGQPVQSPSDRSTYHKQ